MGLMKSMIKKYTCPYIPLKEFRTNQLYQFIYDLLMNNPMIRLRDIYDHVLNHFGDDICQPEIFCPYKSGTEPEFQHVVRLSLWDGKHTKGTFDNPQRGRWKLL